MKSINALLLLILIGVGCSSNPGPRMAPGAESSAADGSARSTAEGTVNGGGGGDPMAENNPWFLGDQPIEYCVRIASGFPIASDQVRKTIQAAFQEWEQTLGRYGLRGQAFAGQFSDGVKRGLTVKAVEVPKCTRPDQQLEFKIGVMDQEVNKHFQAHSKRTVGLAKRRAYNHKTFRTGGFIWIAPQNWIGPTPNPVPNPVSNTISVFPDWTKENWFKAMLLHEIEHVFGVPHVNGTVMDENIFDLLFWAHVYCFEGQVCTRASNSPQLDGTVEPGRVLLNPFLAKRSVSISKSTAVFLAKVSGSGPLLDLFDPSFDGSTTLYENAGKAYVKWSFKAESGERLEFSAAIEEVDDGNGPRNLWMFYSPNYKSDVYRGSDENREVILFLQGYAGVYVGSVDVKGQKYPFSLSLDLDHATRFMKPDGKWTDNLGQ